MKTITRQQSKLAAAKLKTDLDNKQNQLETSQNKMQMYKNMARTYWERWRWESQKRKELLVQPAHCYHQQSLRSSTADVILPPQINPVMLTNLTDGLNNYIGRGSFGIVKLQLYRGIYVAVKQFLPRTFINDILNEAKCLTKLSHPNLPHFLVFAQKSSHIAL